MLPPHRPFREKPSPKVIIKKRYKTGGPNLVIEDREQPGRRALKADVIVINRSAASPATQ